MILLTDSDQSRIRNLIGLINMNAYNSFVGNDEGYNKIHLECALSSLETLMDAVGIKDEELREKIKTNKKLLYAKSNFE